MTSPVSSVSTDKKDENWSCEYCTYSNAMNKVSCEVCYLPNSGKDKNAARIRPDIYTSINKQPRFLTGIAKCFEGRNERMKGFKDCSEKLSDIESEASVSKKSINISEYVMNQQVKNTHETMKSPANVESEAIVSNEKSYISDDDVKNQNIKNLEKLSHNLKELYITGQDTDLTFLVKDVEFKAHKVILRARSSVFNGMFAHELSESNSGIVPIEDCEPAVFEEFLFFVYTARIQNLSCDNACEMYYLAEKYDVQELKEECITFLKKSLSIETVCDVICLSIKFNERELLDIAASFFVKNMEEILVTVQWQLFMRENPTEANELTIKGLKLGFTRKNT